MADRTEIVTEIGIDAPPQRVWDLIGSTERYAEWVVNTLAVTRVDSPVADAGVTYDERNRVMGPWTARSTWRVRSADPPRHTVHEGSGIPLAQDLRLECTLTQGARRGWDLGRASLQQPFVVVAPCLTAETRPEVQSPSRAQARFLGSRITPHGPKAG